MLLAQPVLQEVVDFVQQPDNLKGVVPIEVEDYDPVPYFLSALPITLAVLGTQSAHEVAHRVVASTKKVRRLDMTCSLVITQICMSDRTTIASFLV